MTNNYKGGFFKFMLSLGFLTGAAEYFGLMLTVEGIVAKTGFFIIGVFSLLAFIGCILIDMSPAEYIRVSSKVMLAAVPFAVNAGSVITGLLLVHGKNLFAGISAAVSIGITVLFGYALVVRYVDDDM